MFCVLVNCVNIWFTINIPDLWMTLIQFSIQGRILIIKAMYQSHVLETVIFTQMCLNTYKVKLR